MSYARAAARLLDGFRHEATLYDRLLAIAVEQTALLERQPAGWLARFERLADSTEAITSHLVSQAGELDEWRPVVRLTQPESRELDRLLDRILDTMAALDRQERRNLQLLSQGPAQPRAAVPHA